MKNKVKTTFIISFLSIFVNILLSIGKILAGFVLSSQTLISDAIHSMSDVLSTVIVMIGVAISNKKEDSNHQYGHERFEEIAAMLLGSLLFFTGYEILKNAISTLISGEYNIDTNNIFVGIIICIISILIKFLMYLLTLIKSKKIKSSALKADAYHHLSDSLSSIGGLIGLIFVNFGYCFMDSIAAIIISIFIFLSAIDIIKEAIDKLTDKACDKDEEYKIIEILNKEKDIKIDELKTRMFSNKIYIDLEISMDENISLKEAHSKAQEIHDILEKELPNIKHCMVHINPK